MTKIVCVILIALGCSAALPQMNAAPAAPQDTAPQSSPAFSTGVAEGLVNDFRNGLIAQNQRRVLALFDRQMPGFNDFASAIDLLFSRYDSLRVYSHVTQTATEGTRGIATVEFTLEAVPPDRSGQPPLRRSTQLRLEFMRSGKGWKIVDLQPRDFFANF